jgi:fimbrial chaperone protein
VRSHVIRILLTAVFLPGICAPSQAGSLQVEPVLIDVIAPGAASTVTLRNDGDTRVDAQIRVFRWSQVDGQEKLEPTDDVVASPPAITVAPKTNYVARIVRVSKRPILGEENYRLFVDQLPDLAQQRNGAVKLVVRHSIPVFFGAPDKTIPTLAWSVAINGGQVTVTSRNSGERRLRIAALNLQDSNGRVISFGNGLVGYALGKSTMRWSAHGGAQGFGSGGPVSISAQGDNGPIHAVVSVVRGQ